MPLELTNFDQTGLEVDALGLIVAAAPPNVYADADRGGTQAPEAGSDIGISEGETRISRISILESGARVRLNNNGNPVALTMSEHFGTHDSVSPWTLYLQTDAGVVSSAQLVRTGGGFVNFRFGTEDAAVLNAIAAGDRFLVALARRLLPAAAALGAEAGSLSAALTTQAPGTQPVAAEFPSLAGTPAVALGKQALGSKPVAAAFAGAMGSLSAALTRQAPGTEPLAVVFDGAAGLLAVALSRQRTARRRVAAQLDGAAGSLDAGAVTVLAALLPPGRFLEAIAADLRRQLPALRTCQVHDGAWDAAEVQRRPVAAPALLVAWLGTERTGAPGLDWTDCDQQLAVYVVTADGRERADGKLLRRGEALRNLVDWLLLYIPRARWMARGIGQPENLRARNLYSTAVDKAGVALAEVSWRQTVRLESGAAMDCPELPAGLYAAAQQDPHEQLEAA